MGVDLVVIGASMGGIDALERVLRVLADLQERLGAPLRAAALWMRARRASRTRW